MNFNTYRIKNWEKFQHYKTRKPPWIKLYRDLLDDMQWFCLQGASKGLLIELWILASEHNGNIPSIKEISFRVRKPEKEVNNLLSTLSHWIEQDASAMLADCKQDATLETETETETEREKDICSELQETVASEPAILVFPVKGKTKEWEMTQKEKLILEEAFPGIDILAECRHALGWCKTNPIKQKTARGMTKFLFGWIERSNNGHKPILKKEREVIL